MNCLFEGKISFSNFDFYKSLSWDCENKILYALSDERNLLI